MDCRERPTHPRTAPINPLNRFLALASQFIMSALIITVVGPDRPGLVQAISDQAAEHGANWADSLMANFAGQFAGIVRLEVAPERSETLKAALRMLESPSMQLVVVEAQASAHLPQTMRRVQLDLVGHDRPGIIHSISGELARQGVSIDKLHTHIASGAMSGEQMFHMQAQLSVPAELVTDALRTGLEGLANELMVDISFDSAAAIA